MDDTQRLIVRQVAFKGAIEILPKDIADKAPNGKNAAQFLVDSVKWLTDQFEAIILNGTK